MRKSRPYSILKGGVGKSPLTMRGNVKSSPTKFIPAVTAAFGLGNLLLPHGGVWSQKGRQNIATWGNRQRSKMVYDDYTDRGGFNEAFAAANDELGPGKVFMWDGYAYKTTREDEYPNAYAKEFWEKVIYENPAFKDNPQAVVKLKEMWIDAGMPRIENKPRILGEGNRPATDVAGSIMDFTGDSSGVLYVPGTGSKAASDLVAELAHMKSGLERDDGFLRGSKGRYTQMENFITETVIPNIREGVTLGGVGTSMKEMLGGVSFKDTKMAQQYRNVQHTNYDHEHGSSEEKSHYYGYAQMNGSYIVGSENFVGWSEDERDDSGNPALWVWNEDEESEDYGKKINQRWFLGDGANKGDLVNDTNLRKAYFSQVQFQRDWNELSVNEQKVIQTIVDNKVDFPDGFDLHNGEITWEDLNLNISGSDDTYIRLQSMPYNVGKVGTGDEGKIGGNNFYSRAAVGIDPLYGMRFGGLGYSDDTYSSPGFEDDFMKKNGYGTGLRLNSLSEGTQERLDYYKDMKWNPDATVSAVPFFEDGTPNPNYHEQTKVQQDYDKNRSTSSNPLDDFGKYEFGSTLRAETYNNPGISGLNSRRGIFNSSVYRDELVYNETSKKKEKVGKLLDISISPKDYGLFADIGTYKNNWGDGSEKDVLVSEKYKGVKHLIENDMIYDGQTNRKVEWKEGQKEQYMQELNDYIDSL